MRMDLDICCLKRPFDDQSQPRIHLESEAILALLQAPAEQVEFIRTTAHDLENDQNPVPQRAERVRLWLTSLPLIDVPDQILRPRTDALVAMGFKKFDAFHLASAEGAGAEVFVTCDDRLLAGARRHASSLHVRVVNPIDLVKELFP